MTRTRQTLCAFYATVAVIALFMTWSQNLTYFLGDHVGADPLQYIYDLKANAAARSFTVDIGLFLLGATGLMVVEARRLSVRFVWLYVALGFAIAISVTFPLFLIARELRLAKIDVAPSAVKLSATDILGLALVSAVVLAMCGFILF